MSPKVRRTVGEGIDAPGAWDSVREMSKPEPVDPLSAPTAVPAPAPPPTPEDRRLWVDDGGERRPFMRGIMIHSLMARGVPFEEANRGANTGRAPPHPRRPRD